MNKHFHFIGIGGIGMSGIAQLFLQRGITVSGSDLKESQITAGLKKMGATVFIGHAASHILGAEKVIYSSAIRPDNPEMAAARNQGLPLLKRAQALAELMEGEISITVTGSHGKTTTTSLVAYLLMAAGFSPTVAIGGILKNIQTNASLGKGGFFVAEADESDGSFLYYRPRYSIITNIDYEHLDYYQDFQNELAAFKEFIYQTQRTGCLFACSDDQNLKNMLSGYKNRCLSFGLREDAQVYPKNIIIQGLSSVFDCYYQGKFLDRFSLALGGKHNISNALAAIALGLELRIDKEIIKKALAGYKGSLRRSEIKFQDEHYSIVDDYAHHPTEIKATLAALKYLRAKRIIAVFQPHRYSRTQLLLDEFGKSFSLADEIVVTDIYPAGEPEIPGVSARLIYNKIKENEPDKEVYYLAKETIAEHLLKNIKPGDLVITLGAGDIVKINEELVAKLKRQG